ncbi:MAG: hypothetical protein CMI60_21895 [Parvibaculum sp.]|nr:hypothetical protein [Parvibaculum sp.]
MSEEEQGSADAGNPVEGGAVSETSVQDVQTAQATTSLTTPEWVSDEHRGFVENKGWQTTDDVVKSYVNLERQIGTDRIPLPVEGQDISQWEGWDKLGTPETAEGYELAVPQGYENYNQDMSAWFREKAHEAKVPAHMAQRLHDAFVERAIGQEKDMALDQQRAFEDWGNELKKEYGNSFDEKVGLARRAVRAFGSDTLVDLLNESGLGNHPEMVRAFAKVGAELSSGQQFKDAEVSGSFGMTPEDARAEISRIRANPALMDKTSPENKVLNDRLTQLYEFAHPDQAA